MSPSIGWIVFLLLLPKRQLDIVNEISFTPSTLDFFLNSWSVKKKGLLESIPITVFKYGILFYTLQFKKMLILVSVENPHVQISLPIVVFYFICIIKQNICQALALKLNLN